MKICIERTDRMGDMILTLRIIQGIKELNSQAEIHVVASKNNIKICNHFNGIDRIVPIGQALNINLIWDGYDLSKILTREIEIR